MDGGESSDRHLVPTRDSNAFRLRVRLPSPQDATPWTKPPYDAWLIMDGGESSTYLSTTTVVAGCRCHVVYWPADTSTHVAFALGVCKCPVLEAAAKVSTHMVFLDKIGSPAPSIGTGKTSADSVGGLMRGRYRLKADRDDVKANCVVDKDNNFDVLCSVDIDWTPPVSSMDNELPNLGHDLAVMSDKQEFTDVSFEVGGETFSAHRVVLAARSPVGPMAESKMTTIIIQDKDASTFRSMLHYMYHGSLPNNAGKTVVSSTLAEYQHLFVAADRYGVEMLKKICENKLCASGITADSVVSLLELAEAHFCSKLKARCFDFLAHGDNFKVFATTAEYLNLMQSFPNLLVEAHNRFKIPHEKPTIMKPGSQKKARLC